MMAEVYESKRDGSEVANIILSESPALSLSIREIKSDGGIRYFYEFKQEGIIKGQVLCDIAPWDNDPLRREAKLRKRLRDEILRFLERDKALEILDTILQKLENVKAPPVGAPIVTANTPIAIQQVESAMDDSLPIQTRDVKTGYEDDDSIFDRVVGYFKNLYEIPGEVGASELMLSLATLFLQRTNHFDGRIRKHVLLHWQHGWLKTTILLVMKDILPDFIKANYSTKVTEAALRGSVAGGRFYPPEIKVSDVVIYPELSSIMNAQDAELVGNLLSALEEGRVRVSLVRFHELDEYGLQDAAKYGINVSEGRISYTTDVIVWAASHTLDNIVPSLRRAFLDRFSIVSIPQYLLTTKLASRIRRRQRDRNLEAELRQELSRFFKKDFTLPDKGEVHDVIDSVLSNVTVTVNPRLQYELFKTGLAYLLYGKENLRGLLKCKLSQYLSMPRSKQEVLEGVISTPKTQEEILRETGWSRATFYRVLEHVPYQLVRGEDGSARYVRRIA